MQDWGLCPLLSLSLYTDAAAEAGSSSSRRLERLRLAPGRRTAQQQEQGRLLGEDLAGSAPDTASPGVTLEAVALSETWLVFEQTMREVRVCSAPTAAIHCILSEELHRVVWEEEGNVNDGDPLFEVTWQGNIFSL